MKYLFVGGEGESPWPTMYDRRMGISVSTVSYKREKFADLDGKEYTVYFGTNPAQPLGMLIEGYGGTKA